MERSVGVPHAVPGAPAAWREMYARRTPTRIPHKTRLASRNVGAGGRLAEARVDRGRSLAGYLLQQNVTGSTDVATPFAVACLVSVHDMPVGARARPLMTDVEAGAATHDAETV